MASYTLVLSDAGKMVTMDYATANTLQIPPNSGAGSVAFAVGTRIDICQIGAGQTSFAITTDTLNSSGSKVKLTGQWSMATLWKRTSTAWVLVGDLSA